MLNAFSGLLVIGGIICIRKGLWKAHASFMISAVAVSLIFLISYTTYHAGHGMATRSYPQGPWRPWYLAILISHTILALLVVPMVISVLGLASYRRWTTHRHAGWITFPVWLYVSVTGVVVYLMLYGV